MKKILTTAIILALCAGLAACGGKNNDNAVTTDDAAVTTTPSAVAGDITPDVNADTVGAKHWDKFSEFVKANPTATAEEIAAAVISLEINEFMGVTAPVEEGNLNGFANYEVKGFESGATFCPMIGSIPYVGYIFDLAEGADANAFIKDLNANANLRWNVCVEADQMVSGSVGDKVMFLMCPASYEMTGEGEDEFFYEDIAPETTAEAVHDPLVTEAVKVPETTTEKAEKPVVTTTAKVEAEKPVITTTAENELPMVTVVVTETTKPEEKEEPKAEPVVIAPAKLDASTVGAQHWNKFTEFMSANPAATAEEIAAAVISLEINQFMPATAPVEEGLLNGFGNNEVKGFESGAVFCPMIGSIAYMGYIFDLADGADVNAFIKNVCESANLRWNICVEADQMVAGAVGDKVMFLMCPASYEMAE